MSQKIKLNLCYILIINNRWTDGHNDDIQFLFFTIETIPPEPKPIILYDCYRHIVCFGKCNQVYVLVVV